MNKKFSLWIAALCLFVFAVVPSYAQPSFGQCIGNIKKKLDTLGTQTDFNTDIAREITKDFDFGDFSTALADPQKAAALKRVFTSLSEFCDLAGPNLSAKGMKGYTKFAGVIISSTDDVVSTLHIDHLKAAFSKSGGFNGAGFDNVMKKLGDDTLFDFDAVTGTFTSKSTGVKYMKHPNGAYAQGEGDAITHILQGHTDNDYTAALDPIPNKRKSLFNSPSEALDLIDEAMNPSLVGSRVSAGPNAFWIDLGKVVGKTKASPRLDTSKILIVLHPGTTNAIRTAYPF